MVRKSMWQHIFILGILVALLTACSGLGRPSFRGEVIEPSKAAADINLPDQNGNSFQLSAMQGKIVLIFFGFTNCPDECPLTMVNLKRALNQLGDQSQDVQVVLVTTDPVRDTPQAMKDYLANFNPTFLGITGTLDQLKPVWSDYGVEVMDAGETHSSYTYVIDQGGRMRLAFTPEMNPDDIAADLKALLSEQ